MEYQTQSDQKQAQQEHSQDEEEKQNDQDEQDSKSEDQEQKQDQDNDNDNDNDNSQEQQEEKEENDGDGTETQQRNLEELFRQLLRQQQQRIEYEDEEEEEEEKGSNMFFICLTMLLIVLFVGMFYFRYQEQFFQKNQAMIYDKNYYDILGIQPDSSIENIKDSFKQLVKIWHPDLPQNKNCKKCLKKFMEIKQAYEILSDIMQKELYDSRTKINQIVNFKSQFLNQEMLESSEFLVIQVLIPECDQQCMQFNKIWAELYDNSAFQCIQMVHINGYNDLVHQLPYKIQLYPSVITYHSKHGAQLYPYNTRDKTKLGDFIISNIPIVLKPFTKQNKLQILASTKTQTVILINTKISKNCIKLDALKYEECISVMYLTDEKKYEKVNQVQVFNKLQNKVIKNFTIDQ